MNLTALFSHCFAFLALGLLSSLSVAQEDSASQLADIVISEEQFLDFYQRYLKAPSKLPDVSREIGDVQEAALKMLVNPSGPIATIDWDFARKEAAHLYREEFSPEELKEILTFYQSPAGKKWTNAGPALTDGVITEVLGSISSQMMKPIVLKNLERIKQSFDPAGLAAIVEAANAEPLDPEKLVGTWYGKDQEDSTYHYYWKIERSPNNTQRLESVDIDHDEKIYTAFNSTDHWMIVGRLMLETGLQETDYTTIFIIEELTDDSITYRIAEEELPMAEWTTGSDERKEVKIPPAPAGYEVDN